MSTASATVLATDDRADLPTAAEQRNAPGADEQGALILVIDDLESNTMMLEAMLEAGGFRTIIATDGPSGIEAARVHQPELILLDLVMPGVSGVETCRRLKQTEWGQRIPVVFVTGASDQESLIDAFAAGGVDYLSKPVYPQELLARMGVHLKLRRAERELEARNQELERAAQELELSNRRLAELSRIDGLTGLLNRRTWDAEAHQIDMIASRCNRMYSVMMVDVDLFKAYNDHQGHQAGDECLSRVAGAILKSLRQMDVAGRYGGEEFVVLLPETTWEPATKVAERVRQSVWELAIPHGKSPAQRVTVSIGVADSAGRNLAATIGTADHGLYMAKRHGRNLVFGPPAPHLLPATSACRSTAAAPDITGSGQHLKHVVVIGDDPSIIDACRQRLSESTFRFEHVPCSAFDEAMRKSHTWSTLVLDLRAAEEQMVELLGQCRANPATRLVPAIGLCDSDPEVIKRVLGHGFDDILDISHCDYQIKTRIAAMCQLHAERAALERSYQLRGEQVRVLAYTVECAQRASQARTWESVCEVLLKGAAEIMASQFVALSLYPNEHTIAWDSGSEPALDLEAAYRIPEPSRASLMRAETVVEDPGESSEADPYPHTSSFHIRLESGGAKLGVLTAHRRLRQQPFTEHDAEMYKVFACLVASLVSESLYHQARDEAISAFVKALAGAAESRDHLTGQHVQRVSYIAGVIADQLRRDGHPEPISDQFVLDLRLAAPLHDIGKMSVPDSILRKPDKLTVHEMAIMRMHCDLGADIFTRLVENNCSLSFATVAMDVIKSHHEYYNGKGYPGGLAGTQIPLASRIVAVADAYDAIVNDRVYRKARTHEEAVQIIARGTGEQFDPAIVTAFIACADAIALQN